MSMIRKEEMKKKNSKNERGATLVEYALLVALVAIAAVGALQVLGTNISTSFSNLGSQVTSATN